MISKSVSIISYYAIERNGQLKGLKRLLRAHWYGNSAKVDKFCAYLENNGPAAFHVADGKNVDLNWIYREVIG